MFPNGSADAVGGKNNNEGLLESRRGLQYFLPTGATIARQLKASFIILVHISFSKTIWKHRHARWANPPDLTLYSMRERHRDGGRVRRAGKWLGRRW